MSSDVKSLQLQLQLARSLAKSVRRELRAHQKSAQQSSRRAEANEARIKAVGFRVLALASDAPQALRRWLELKLPTGDKMQTTAMHTQIIDEFVALDTDIIVTMLEPIARADVAVLRDAKAMLKKWDLYSWVCEQNVVKGLAPSVAAIIQQRDCLAEVRASAGSDVPALKRSRSASYKWLSKWRQKWIMPKGKIGHKDMPTPSEMRLKVRAAHKSLLVLIDDETCAPATPTPPQQRP